MEYLRLKMRTSKFNGHKNIKVLYIKISTFEHLSGLLSDVF